MGWRVDTRLRGSIPETSVAVAEIRPGRCPHVNSARLITVYTGHMGDLRLGFRLLWKDTAFTVTAVLTLALCIGANVAVFTIVHSVLLKPLPVPESDRIVLMGNAYPGQALRSLATPPPLTTSIDSVIWTYLRSKPTMPAALKASIRTALRFVSE